MAANFVNRVCQTTITQWSIWKHICLDFIDMGLYEKISSMLDIITEGGLSTHLISPLLKIPWNVALVLQLPQQNQLKFIQILLWTGSTINTNSFSVACFNFLKKVSQVLCYEKIPKSINSIFLLPFLMDSSGSIGCSWWWSRFLWVKCSVNETCFVEKRQFAATFGVGVYFEQIFLEICASIQRNM